LQTNEKKPAIEALTEEANKVAIERLGDAIATAVQTADIQDVLALLTGAFVSLTLEMLRREGHEPTGAIRLDGGENRDITIHESKV
jgi:ketosteroid isomerase-like protein